MKKVWLIICFGLFSLVLLTAGTDEEKQKISMEIANSLCWDNYYLSGLTAWDRLSLVSIQTKLILKGSLPEREGQNFIVAFAVRRPVTGNIFQLDQEIVTVDTDAASFFYGAYNLWGYQREWTLDNLYYGYFFGPALDYYYQEGDSLFTIGMDGGIKWGQTMGKHFYSGMEIGLGVDLWGNHTLGDETRYSGTVSFGVNGQSSFFMGWHY